MIPKSQELSSDHKLLKQTSLGNELSFAHFYDKYWDSLYLSAYKVLRDEEAGKDIVQEVFLDIWKKKDLAALDNVRAYLHQSVRFKVLMALRKGKVTDRHLATLEELSVNTTEEQINLAELNESLERTINALPDKCREVFRLSRIEHFSNAEIAEKLNISIRTVEKHISNALKYLRANLDTSAALILYLFLF